jgi:hypothetical protein
MNLRGKGVGGGHAPCEVVAVARDVVRGVHVRLLALRLAPVGDILVGAQPRRYLLDPVLQSGPCTRFRSENIGPDLLITVLRLKY